MVNHENNQRDLGGVNMAVHLTVKADAQGSKDIHDKERNIDHNTAHPPKGLKSRSDGSVGTQGTP